MIALFAAPRVAISGDGAPHDLVRFRQNIETLIFVNASEFAYLNDNKNTLTVWRLAGGGSSD